MVKQKKRPVRSKSVKKGRKAAITFKKGLLLIRRGVENSKFKSLKGQAGLALKLGRNYFGQGKKIKLPASVALKSFKGGFLLSALAGIASAVGVISGISTIVSNYKKIKADSERLKIEKRRGQIFEDYFLAGAGKVKGQGLALSKAKKGFLLKLKCAKGRK